MPTTIDVRHRVAPARLARNVYFDRDQVEELDRLAQEQQRSFSFLARAAVDAYLNAQQKSEQG